MAKTVNQPWQWINENTRAFMARGYLVDGQTTEERVKAIALHAEKTLGQKGFAEKFERYMSLGWISLATPVWANFGLKRGLPISCFGSYVGDSVVNFLDRIAFCA